MIKNRQRKDPVEFLRKRWRGLVSCLVVAVLLMEVLGPAILQAQAASGGEKTLLPEVWYHLDMGVQLAYFDGIRWEEGYAYGSHTRPGIQTHLSFPREIQVTDVYPLESSKGRERFDFGGSRISHNLPSGLGRPEDAYLTYYQKYGSSGLTVADFKSQGTQISFSYDALLDTPIGLDVYDYGEAENPDYVYRLFGGENRLRQEQPRIHQAVKDALDAGEAGLRGDQKLYLIFCPNVIEYQVYGEPEELRAELELPASADRGEEYLVRDASVIGDGTAVDQALLERRRPETGSDWEEVARWPGKGPGEHTGGVLPEIQEELGVVEYRLTVISTSGSKDSALGRIQITDGRTIEGQATLNLQPETYEGHPAWAVDESRFRVDGTDYTARRAYEEGVASNRFRAPYPGASVRRQNSTEAEVTFQTRGSYLVNLEVDLANGTTLQDSKPILVHKTPAILDSLGGIQKQNRKQTLTISVATHPGHPLADYQVELTDLETGEVMSLTPEAQMDNTSRIKSRELKVSGGTSGMFGSDRPDPYWTTLKLEFLTKAPSFSETGESAGSYQYRIFVRDQKGDTDLVERNFQVVPDRPPEPEILIQDTFFREEKSNQARILVRDGTVTDGDQLERSWTLGGIPISQLSGFEDKTFGSLQEVEFFREGVGPFRLDLQVKDRWIEPTLEEYVTEEDRLGGSVFKESRVLNIAPVVSLKPIQGQAADIFMTAVPEIARQLEEMTNGLKGMLLEKGVAADIRVIRRAPEDQGGYQQVFYKTWKSAMWCPSTCREIGPIYDSDYVFTVESNSIVNQHYSQLCDGTHTLYANSATGTNPDWNYTVNRTYGFRVRLDNREKYVYIISHSEPETILLDRNTGAEAGILPVALQGEIFLSSRGDLYTVDGTGIYRYSRGNRSMERIAEGGSLPRLLEGKISFIARDPSGPLGNRFYLGQLDPETGELSGRRIPEIPSDQLNWTAGNRSDVQPVDMDHAGRVLFVQTYLNSNFNTGQNSSIWLADSRTGQVASLPFQTPMGSATYYLKGHSVGFVRDSRGMGTHVYISYYQDENRYNTRIAWNMKLFEIQTGEEELKLIQRASASRQTNNHNFSSISYARFHEAENKIYLLRGSAFQGYDWGGVQTGDRMTFQLPGYGRGETVTQWDAADEYATENGFLSATYYFYEQWINPENRVKIFKNSITKEQAADYAEARHLPGRGAAGNIFLIRDPNPNPDTLADLAAQIHRELEQRQKNQPGGEIRRGEILEGSMNLAPGGKYGFEYEGWTEEGRIPEADFRLTVSAGTSGEEGEAGDILCQRIASHLDLTNPFSRNHNTFYALATSSYLEGRGGYGAGYYGKKGQSRDYFFTVDLLMEEEGFTDFDLFVTFGYQVAGSWGILVNGSLVEEGEGSMEGKRTIFLPAGYHRLTFRAGILSGSHGYIGISRIRSTYLLGESGSATFQRQVQEDGWTRVQGTFTMPEAYLMRRTEEIREGELRETFSGNTPDLIQYLRFTANQDCPWSFSQAEGRASMGSSYQVSAVGSFGIQAPVDRHLILSFDESVSIPRLPVTSTLSGGARMIGKGTYLIPAGGSFARNYTLERGRSGGYGSVRISSIRVAEIEGWVPPGWVFGLEGSSDLDLHQRSQDVYLFRFLPLAELGYEWHRGSHLTTGGGSDPGRKPVQILLPGSPEGGRTLYRNFKLYENVNPLHLLIHQESFQDGREAAANLWRIPGREEAIPIPIGYRQIEEPEEPNLVYRKGELVLQQILYQDYEEDPSRRGFWQYDHEPMNDGLHPDSGALLFQPIHRFYKDGKYVLTHWQEDNTSRSSLPLDLEGFPMGNPGYDKESNRETLTFYILGSQEAPWIQSIETGRDAVGGGRNYGKENLKPGDFFDLKIRVDDREKEELTLITEVFRDGKEIYTHRKEGILPVESVEGDPGELVYPPVFTGIAGKAIPGVYQVVCRVSDATGTGMGTYRFTIEILTGIRGEVLHTEEWNRKRMEFNRVRPPLGNLEAPRGKEIFWPGEAFELKAYVLGDPIRVTAEIQGIQNFLGNPVYRRILQRKPGPGPNGEALYEGRLWEPDMMNRWGRASLMPLTFRFVAWYEEDQAEDLAGIILDNREPWQALHRVW
jgi:hypothetical protein